MVKRHILDADKIDIDLKESDSSKRLKTATSAASPLIENPMAPLVTEVLTVPLVTEDTSNPVIPALGECIRPNAPTEAGLAEGSTSGAIGERPESDSSESNAGLSPDRSSSDDELEDESGDKSPERKTPVGDCFDGTHSVKFEWTDNGSSAEASRFRDNLSEVTKGLNGIVDTISIYKGKLVAADAAVKVLKAEARRLRRDYAALVKSEQSWLALQKKVALMKEENVLLSRMALKKENLRTEIKELKRSLASDTDRVALKAEFAILKKLIESDAEIREAELARSRELHEEELHYFGREVFRRTKAFYAPLVEKVQAYLAERGPMISSLLGVNRHESVLIALNTLERDGFKLPEGLKGEVEAFHERAKTDLVVTPRVEITDSEIFAINCSSSLLLSL